MPLTDAASDARRDDVVAAASKPEIKQTDKQKKINEWVSKISLDDIVFSETEWIKLGRDEEQKTRLQSVKGLPSFQLTVYAPTRLCVHFRISCCKDKTKHVLCELIVNAAKAKNLDAIMYPNNFGGAAATAMNDSTENETTSTKAHLTTLPIVLWHIKRTRARKTVGKSRRRQFLFLVPARAAVVRNKGCGEIASFTIINVAYITNTIR